MTTTLTIAHSPDPDDVFMWWPLGSPEAEPVIETEGLRFTPIAEDIQLLNRRAIEHGDLDITAVSIHAYPHIRRRYRLTACAGSFGDSYGPKVVARSSAEGLPVGAEAERWLMRPELTFAIPGRQTTACLALELLLGRPVRAIEMRFDEIPGAVAEGRCEAGLLIHDAQLTYGTLGLVEITDLGLWWREVHHLPLALGGNVVRRDLDDRLGPGASSRVARTLHRSIRHALEHMDEGVRRIGPIYPALDEMTLRRYLGMYVNDLTLDAGAEGRRAIETLLMEGHRRGLCPDPGEIDPLPHDGGRLE